MSHSFIIILLHVSKMAVANKCLNETTEGVGTFNIITVNTETPVLTVHLYRPTLVTNLYIDQFIENLYSNCVVRFLVVVMFNLCDRDVVCL